MHALVLVDFAPCKGIKTGLDSGFPVRIPDSRYCILVFVSGTWGLDFNR